MNYEKLKAQLTIDEDRRKRIYVDTVGKVSGGIGRNLTDRGFSDDEIDLMFRNDILIVEHDLDFHLPWWRKMNDARQNVIMNMCFNLGIARLKGFKNTLRDMEAGNYAAAAEGMKASLWARQVGDRAQRLAAVMVKGDFL